MVVLMIDQEFLPTGYRLNIFCPLPLKLDVADAIGLQYSRLPLKTKSKFNANKMQVEIRRLNILVVQECRRVSGLEAEIKYIETLEA